MIVPSSMLSFFFRVGFFFLNFFSFEERTEDFLVEAASDSEIIVGGLTALTMLSAGKIFLNCVSFIV